MNRCAAFGCCRMLIRDEIERSRPQPCCWEAEVVAQFAESKAEAGKRAQSLLCKTYKHIPLYVGEDPGFPIQGPTQLKEFGNSVFGKEEVAVACSQSACDGERAPSHAN